MKKYFSQILEIDISDGLTESRFEIEAGQIFYQTGSANLTIKLHSRANNEIDLTPKDCISAGFKVFYLTAPATDETIKLFISKPEKITIDSKGFFDLTNDKLQRESITTIENTAYYNVQDATLNVLPAGDNVNGCIIRIFCACSEPLGGQVLLKTIPGTDKIARIRGYSESLVITNIYVPAGRGLAIVADTANSSGSIWYELL